MIGRLSASTMFLRIVALVIAVLFALVIAFSSPSISEAKKGKGKHRHHHSHSKKVNKKKKKGFECSPTNVQVAEYQNTVDQDLQCFRVS